MTAPGSTISITASAAAATIDAQTGHAMVVGLTQRGPVGTPVTLHSLGDYTTLLGSRVSYGQLYDWADVFFREGGSTLLVSRIVGPAAASASVTLKDRAGSPLNTLTVTSIGPGVDGNLISVAVVNGVPANTFQLQITYNGTLVEASAVCGSPTDAVNWSQSSNWVRITDAGSATAAPNNNPAVASATALTGGADDNSNAGDTQYEAGLTAFVSGYGPGQVCAPGRTSAAVHEALLTHAQANNRVALLDAVNTATASTITSAAGTEQAAVADPSYGTTLAPWVTCPGIPTGTTEPAYPRTVPPSALVAGLIARSDAGGNVNDAPAGDRGVAAYCLDVTAAYTDADRSSLDAAGVSVIRNFGVPGSPQVKLYGWTSMAEDPAWSDLSSVRLRMAIGADLQAAADSFEFSQLDGQGHTLSAFHGALVATLSSYWIDGSLYGATAGDAFQVNTGPQVNTPTVAAARTLAAQISLRMSPSAEFVTITVTKTPITTALVA